MGGLDMKRITILFAAAALVVTVFVPAVLASGGGTRIVLKAAKAFPAAKGSATFKAKPGERELEVEVEHIRRLAGKRVAFFLAGKRLGTARVSAFGEARIERNTERGQFVPAVSAGTGVRARTAAGILIVKGSF
jgi:hypothetical protein